MCLHSSLSSFGKVDARGLKDFHARLRAWKRLQVPARRKELKPRRVLLDEVWKDAVPCFDAAGMKDPLSELDRPIPIGTWP